MSVRVRPMSGQDPAGISGAFAELGVDKPVSLYERYLVEQARGERVGVVAEDGGRFVGYVTVVWSSSYPPFLERGIPELADLNVLPFARRRGIGSALLDAAEALVAERSSLVGIGVGMDPDYGPAQAMYVRRGYVPDARGLTSWGKPVCFGDTVPVDDALVLYLTRRLRR